MDKKKIEKAGGTCLHIPGCPPGEPAPAWTIVDRKEFLEGMDPGDVRKRHVEEEKIFKKWLEEQTRD